MKKKKFFLDFFQIFILIFFFFINKNYIKNNKQKNINILSIKFFLLIKKNILQII